MEPGHAPFDRRLLRERRDRAAPGFDYTKLGGEALMRERGITGFGSGMTGFADVLDDGEIWDILAWIRSTWPDDIREIQSGRNPVHRR